MVAITVSEDYGYCWNYGYGWALVTVTVTVTIMFTIRGNSRCSVGVGMVSTIVRIKSEYFRMKLELRWNQIRIK